MGQSRRYASPTRDEAALRTRRRILEVAQRLFLRDGYAAVTMSALAAEAGVTVATVYNSVGGKSAVLKQVCDALLAGDDRRLRFADRPELRDAHAGSDPGTLLLAYFRDGAGASTPVGQVLRLVREGAAAGDADLRALVGTIDRERHAGATMVASRLAELAVLRDGYDPARAADVLWMLHSPDVWTSLVQARGWPPEDYAHWCADAAAATLLSSAQDAAALGRSRRLWFRGPR